jgi:hypothetical protein
VVEGLPTTFQIPDSGQISPVLAVVPIGAFDIIEYFKFQQTYFIDEKLFCVNPHFE